MIKELRIDNLVLYGAHGPVLVIEVKKTGKIRVEFLAETSIEHGYYKKTMDISQFEPIPLTPEWLERFGFKIETIPDSVDDEGDIIKGYTHWTNGKFCFHFSDGKVEGRDHIQSVHLLQNWYYFSTGEEFQIKNI